MHKFLYWLISSNFLFHCHILGLKFFYTLSFQKCQFALSLFVSFQVSDAYVNVLSIIVFFSLNFSLWSTFPIATYYLFNFLTTVTPLLNIHHMSNDGILGYQRFMFRLWYGRVCSYRPQNGRFHIINQSQWHQNSPPDLPNHAADLQDHSYLLQMRGRDQTMLSPQGGQYGHSHYLLHDHWKI